MDDVIFAVHRRDLDRLEDLFLSLQEQGIRTRFAMDLFPHTRAQVQLEDLDGIPLLSFATDADEPDPAHGQARPGRGRWRLLLLVLGTAGGAGDRPADQAHLGRQRPLPPDPLRAERPLLHPLQVPHHGGGRRGAPPRAAAPQRDGRAGVQAAQRSAGDRFRPLPAPLQPRRAAAALERAARRHEPGRPASADPRGSGASTSAGSAGAWP